MNTPSIFSRAGVRQIGADIMGGMGAGQHPRISIRGQMFHLVDMAGQRYPAPIQLFGQVPTLQCIIIGANPVMSKVYFEGDYDPDQGTPPTCFSDNGQAPSRNASRKMARTCAECELSAWGSATSKMTGKAVKACVDKKKIAVLVIGDTTGLIYELQVPPASLRNLTAHAGKIGSFTVPDGSGRKAELSDFVTGIQFTPDRTGELQFIPLCWLDSVGYEAFQGGGGKTYIALDGSGAPALAPDGGLSIAGIVDAAWDSGQVEEVTGSKDQPWTGTVLGAPAQPKAYLEAQPQGGALQRGSRPVGPAAAAHRPVATPHPAPETGRPHQGGGYAGQTGQAPSQPVRAFQPPPPVHPTPGPGVTTVVTSPARQAAKPTPDQGDIPDFLKRARAGAPQAQTPVEVPANPPAPPAAPVANFGMTDAPRPPADIGAAINRAMSLPTAGK